MRRWPGRYVGGGVAVFADSGSDHDEHVCWVFRIAPIDDFDGICSADSGRVVLYRVIGHGDPTENGTRCVSLRQYGDSQKDRKDHWTDIAFDG